MSYGTWDLRRYQVKSRYPRMRGPCKVKRSLRWKTRRRVWDKRKRKSQRGSN
jgi:hypothetical protein